MKLIYTITVENPKVEIFDFEVAMTIAHLFSDKSTISVSKRVEENEPLKYIKSKKSESQKPLKIKPRSKFR